MLFIEHIEHSCDHFLAEADLSVSWVRQRDLHILTAGEYVYTSDQRFRSIHHENGWTLEIRDAQINDSGVYECQISTETKLSASVFLNIIGEYKPMCNHCSL
ncbi:hypothetical protein B4U80_03140 [Leptotrombidium deliense]|uniref:Ig-like domain-containing protein n=1 Tax=Leptotrombidium deliense TaxID=299467 RepID=A0A443SK41_9ACAR|nr:hypothetical protein B4U80_03140 [Leptotrombidium deliense]